MSNLPAQVEEFTSIKSTDEGLLALSQFGNPMLWRSTFEEQTGSWRCSLDVFVPGKGVEFKVRSDNFPAPYEAVQNCMERLYLTLRGLV